MRASSSAAFSRSVAAPIAMLRGPSSLIRMPDAATELTRVRRATVSRSGSSSNSPSRVRPPPRMTIDGFIRFSRPATAIPEVLGRLSSDSQRELISLERGVFNHVDGQLTVRQDALWILRQQRFLHASPELSDPTNVARHPRSPTHALLAARIDGHVTDFAGNARRTSVDLTGNHVTGADTRAHFDEREIFGLGAPRPTSAPPRHPGWHRCRS